nr:hypothetical protein [uncultured Marinifilum sp.]
MKTKFYQIVFLCIAFLGMANVVNAQTKGTTYNPFTIDNVNALANTEVVTEDSYHTYTYTGDVNLTGSTFVFKVVGGTIVNAIGDPTLATLDNSNGVGTHSILEVDNKASIIVKWDAENGDQKYVAAYEISSTNCITTGDIGGLKISVGTKPTITLASTDLDACSQDGIPVDITITNGESPWTATINDGTDDITFYFSTEDVSGVVGYDHVAQVTVASNAFTYTWNATGYLNTNVDGSDVTYTFEATKVDDKITAAETNDTGIIGTEDSVTATVHPLPVVGTMGQDL